MANNNSPWTDPAQLSDGSKNKAKAKRSPRQEMTSYGKSGPKRGFVTQPKGMAAMDTHPTGFKPSKGVKSLPRP